jgi:hypothetical protein
MNTGWCAEASLLYLPEPSADDLAVFSFAATGLEAIMASTRFNGGVVGMRVSR